MATWRHSIHRFASVVCVATADIDAQLWTNKQQIATRFAEEVPVLYVESLGLRRPRPTPSDARRIARRVTGWRSNGRSRGSNGLHLSTVAPIVVPFHGFEPLSALNRRLLRSQLHALVAELPKPRLLWAYSPLAAWIASSANWRTIAYHCVDDLATQPRMPMAFIRRLERELATAADFVFTSSPALTQRMSEINAATLLTPNVADWQHFAGATKPGEVAAELRAIREPRAIFVGSLSDYKLDWSLLRDVARQLPDWSFVFVGPRGDEQRTTGCLELAGLENVHLLGPQPIERLPDFFRGAAVGLLPYRLTEHTRSIYPLKTIEYLAAGLPVVSTPLESLRQTDLPLSFAQSADEFATAIRRTNESRAARRALSASVKDHDWDHLLDSMFDAFDGGH